MNSLSAEQAAFAAALACATPAERVACLNAHCGGDAALRRRVEALLKAATQAGDFLESPPAGPAWQSVALRSSDEISEQPGDRIGRYKLLEKIGEGGCGVVYMADQEEPVRRRVALKVIKPQERGQEEILDNIWDEMGGRNGGFVHILTASSAVTGIEQRGAEFRP